MWKRRCDGRRVRFSDEAEGAGGMTRALDGRERSVWVTRRDEQMLEWFAVVRIADMASVRWVLGALNGWTRPVSLRQAQDWCARMQSVGLVDRLKQGGPGGSIVWATPAGTGRPVPHLFRQTTRHEIAVAMTSARYVTGQFAWQYDDDPEWQYGHQTDGIAFRPGYRGLIEVELTPKRRPRYAKIFDAFQRRLYVGDGTEVVYLCTEPARAAVVDALQNTPGGRALIGQLRATTVFDRRGFWAGEQLEWWLRPRPVGDER